MNGLRAASVYQDPLRLCIHALKYDGLTRLAEPLGALLAQTYVAYGMQAEMIIPVPLHRERLQQRGYNQEDLLAKVCAEHLGLPVHTTIVQRLRNTPAQVSLSAVERRSNMHEAFGCSSTLATAILSGRKILIVDDVYTTGATLEACATPLLAAGAASVWGLVVARPNARQV